MAKKNKIKNDVKFIHSNLPAVAIDAFIDMIRVDVELLKFQHMKFRSELMDCYLSKVNSDHQKNKKNTIDVDGVKDSSVIGNLVVEAKTIDVDTVKTIDAVVDNNSPNKFNKCFIDYFNSDVVRFELSRNHTHVLELSQSISPVVFFSNFYAFNYSNFNVSISENYLKDFDDFSKYLKDISNQVEGVVTILEQIISTKKIYSVVDRANLVDNLELDIGNNPVDNLLRTAPDYLSPFIEGYKFFRKKEDNDDDYSI